MANVPTSALFVIGIVLALWLAGAVWALARGLAMQRSAAFATAQSRRLAALVEASPTPPMVVRGDWRVETSARVGAWLGLAGPPTHFDELGGGPAGLPPDQLAMLRDAIVAAQRAARPFSLVLEAQGSARQLRVTGAAAAPAVGGPASVLLWFSDDTDAHQQGQSLRDQRDEAQAAFAALSGLIEAAPFPMWFRGDAAQLVLVNAAYVQATEAEDADSVVARGVELVETVAGVSALDAATQAQRSRSAVHRVVPVTVSGERRIMGVVDVPLLDAKGLVVGVAGYAIDRQDLENERAAQRRAAESQRNLIDRLSAAVAEFGADRSLTFANQPFRRLFGLTPQMLADAPDFAWLLDEWRSNGRLPELRDFPEWRQEHLDWFAQADAQEEEWHLADGTHLRIIAQPTPSGGLVLITEDRTEQAQLASTRDTLLRVRTATFDNLFEAVAVFAPDGRLHQWNQRFRRVWGVEETVLAAHPRVDALLNQLSDRLVKPAQVSIILEIIRGATLERRQRGGRLRYRDGRHFDFAAIPLPDGNALFLMLDVTDSQRAETALRERNDALEAADRVKTAFLSRMSYELRTLLTSIGGFAEMLAGGYAGALPPKADDYVGAILESVTVLSRQIDNVLDLAQAEAGTLAITRNPENAAAMLNAAADAARPLAAEAGARLRTTIPADLGLVMGDAVRLTRLIAQLLDNAIRFTVPARGKRADVLLHAETAGEKVRIIVSDNGPGLPDHVAAIMTGRAAGTDAGGIGLALARRLVDSHGGTMDIISKADLGTLVTIDLPRGA